MHVEDIFYLFLSSVCRIEMTLAVMLIIVYITANNAVAVTHLMISQQFSIVFTGHIVQVHLETDTIGLVTAQHTTKTL